MYIFIQMARRKSHFYASTKSDTSLCGSGNLCDRIDESLLGDAGKNLYEQVFCPFVFYLFI